MPPASIVEWEEGCAALNEDLSCILLGEPPPWRDEEGLRQARRLADELARLGSRLERSETGQRIRAIAVALAGVLEETGA